MNIPIIIILGILTGGYLIIILIAFLRLIRSNLFTKKQKIFNSIMILLIPFLWIIFIWTMTKKENEMEIIQKLKEKDKHKGNSIINENLDYNIG